jgi:hypothetical protein
MTADDTHPDTLGPATGPESPPDLAGRTSWNSLEVAKLAVSSLTPVAVALLAFMLAQQNHRRDLAREEAARIEAIQSARESAIAQKRVELWDKLGPRLSRINFAFNSEHVFPPHPDARAVRAEAEESENLLATFQIYLPKAFNDEVWNYLTNVEEAVASFENQDITNDDYVALRANYVRVLEAARSALGVQTAGK